MRGKKTDKNERLIEQYSSCPAESRVYEADGKKYAVTRHFTGEKSINQVITGLAVSRADRQTRLP